MKHSDDEPNSIRLEMLDEQRRRLIILEMRLERLSMLLLCLLPILCTISIACWTKLNSRSFPWAAVLGVNLVFFSLAILKRRKLRKLSAFHPKSSSLFSRLPRLWQLFPYLLSKKTREQVYEPHYNEVLEDYTLA